MATADVYLALSNKVYEGPGGPAPEKEKKEEEDWKKVSEDWKQVQESEATPPNEGTANGYFGVAYENQKTGEIIVANRGSRPSLEGVKQDWVGSDGKIAGQGAFGIPAAFKDSIAFATLIRRRFPGRRISFTGHSLGGAEAQFQAAILGRKAVTFGAPGVAFAVSPAQAEAAAHNIVNYVLPGDPVTKAGTHIGQVVTLETSSGGVLKSLVVLSAAFAMGGPFGVLIAALGMFAANHPLGNYANALSGVFSPGGGRPAARLTDLHVCPMVTGIVPHVGGPISGPCSPNVFIGGLPAAKVGDMLVCVGPPDTIVMGSSTVFINGQPSARLGDMTTHGGVITVGFPTVLING